MQDQIVFDTQATGASVSPLKRSAIRSPRVSKQGMLERLFAFAFDGLVYPQIWEDPVVDMEAMQIEPGHHVVAIASGGCNVMSYLAANPGKITAVDLNKAHLALLELKINAARHLRAHEDFLRFFASADQALNLHIFELLIAPNLTREALEYWTAPRRIGGQRIEMFSRGFYRHGLLGRFIAAAHIAARLHGVNPREIMQLKTLDEQRWFFAEKLSPLFDRKLIRWLTSSPMSLYGLGIPPAQYTELAEGRHMADVLRDRLGKLACDFPLSQNYFARQAFDRCYGELGDAVDLPPYLQAANWQAVRAGADRIEAANSPITDVLKTQPERSVDRIALLDAQDWMSEQQLSELWSAINSSAAPGARVIFRTAGSTSPLESKVAPSIMASWVYDVKTSTRLSACDRSAIYGAFHLYRLRP